MYLDIYRLHPGWTKVSGIIELLSDEEVLHFHDIIGKYIEEENLRKPENEKNMVSDIPPRPDDSTQG